MRTPLLLLLALALSSAAMRAQVYNNVQSIAQPFGLSIVDKVQTAGSDAAAAQFQGTTLPTDINFLQKNLPEYIAFAKASQYALDPSLLKVSVDSTARVYFLSEGAGYHNTLGYNTLAPGQTPTGGLTDSAKLIFPDASSSVSSYYTPATPGVRTASEPLLPGDFVDLGKISAGSTLDFWLGSNSAYGGQNIWTDSMSRNPDGVRHMAAFSLPNSPFLMISFEDMAGGGDRDTNDVVIVVQIEALKSQQLISAPEPSAWLSLLGFGLVALIWRRSRMNIKDQFIGT